MPKEKATTRKSAKSADKSAGGKKKKGKFDPDVAINRALLTHSPQTPTCQSAVSLPTCSSPTSSVIRSARRTLASSSVSPHWDVPSPQKLLTESVGEVGKLLGEKWKGLNEKQKAPYEAKAAADKKRYEEEKAAYTAVSRIHASFPHSPAHTSSRVAMTRTTRSRHICPLFLAPSSPRPCWLSDCSAGPRTVELLFPLCFAGMMGGSTGV